jgi:hypothetical protein
MPPSSKTAVPASATRETGCAAARIDGEAPASAYDSPAALEASIEPTQGINRRLRVYWSPAVSNTYARKTLITLQFGPGERARTRGRSARGSRRLYCRSTKFPRVYCTHTTLGMSTQLCAGAVSKRLANEANTKASLLVGAVSSLLLANIYFHLTDMFVGGIDAARTPPHLHQHQSRQ